MGISEAIELAKEAAAEWRSLREMPAPRVVDVDAIAVHLIEVDVPFEKRMLSRDLAPAPVDATASAAPVIDAWSIEVEGPRDGSAWTKRVSLSEPSGVIVCPVCEGKRAFSCDDCGGAGQKLVEEYEPLTGVRVTYYVPCGTCAGRGNIHCDTCRAHALVCVTPAIEVQTGTVTRRSIVHGGRLDAALVAEIIASGSALPLAPTLVAETTGDEVPRGLSSEVGSVLRELGAQPDAAGTRSGRRRARIHSGWVVVLKLKDRVLHVWGEPARVGGDDDPVETGGRTAVWIAASVGVVAVVGAIVYFLMT